MVRFLLITACIYIIFHSYQLAMHKDKTLRIDNPKSKFYKNRAVEKCHIHNVPLETRIMPLVNALVDYAPPGEDPYREERKQFANALHDQYYYFQYRRTDYVQIEARHCPECTRLFHEWRQLRKGQ